jgi:hypothetical protein
MKHETSHGSSRSALTVKTMIGGVAAAALLGLSMNAQAQTCVVDNWSTPVGLTNADAGTQGADNRRYAGPCGLRTPGGVAAYVTDETPSAEGSYIARFYAYLDDAGTDPVIIYEATDGTDFRVRVWYNADDTGAASPGDVTLQVADNGADTNFLTFTGVGSGWHSIEFVWEAAASADIRFSVNGAADATFGTALDTSGFQIADASLGNVNGGATGTMDFDDFDSRRISRPGRLCRGLTAAPGDPRDFLNLSDFFAIFSESSGSGVFANGQPDYDQNGIINISDAFGVYNQTIVGNESCDLNS